MNQSSDERFANAEWYYRDNGFRSARDMHQEHEPVVGLATELLSHSAGAVLDLGCGNGVLLKKICRANGNLVPWGVDRSSDAIAHARLLTPRYADHFIMSNIFHDCIIWSEGRGFELVILMLGRVADAPRERADELLNLIKERTTNLLVYAYDAVLHQHGSLDELAQKAGVRFSDRRMVENAAMVDLDRL